MAEKTNEEVEVAPKKKGRFVLAIVGMTLLAGSAAAGYYASTAGFIPLPERKATEQKPRTPGTADDVVFIPLQPLVITLGRDAKNSHLRFNAQLEVIAEYEKEVARMEPRFLDVLNSYLQALEGREIEDPDAYFKIRLQALRRMQLVAGDGRIRDLLITEFVLN